MRVVGFVLDDLHGLGELKTNINGRIVPTFRTTTYVSTMTKYICKYFLKCYVEWKFLHFIIQTT
jgi:hypothetical protein